MKTKVIIFRLGELDCFTGDPREVLSESGFDSSGELIEFNELAAAALTRGNPALSALFADAAEYLCCASRPRTVRALLDFGGIDFRSKKITWLALDYDPAALKRAHGTPWFPVIDRERCTGCGICHDYCLFSTYIRDDRAAAERRIQVQHPLNCKTGCPACARLCRSNALIFPFNPEPTINGALDVIGSQPESELLRAFDADPMKVLEERRKKRRLMDEQRVADAERDSFSQR